MNKYLISLFFISTSYLTNAQSRDFYISPNGNDNTADGSIEKPYRSLKYVQELVNPGDRVIFHGGTYKPTVENSMGERSSIYSCAFILEKDGEEGKPITYMAYPGEQPIFDMSEYKPENKRVSVFYVSGSWLHIKGLEVTGTQVTISDGSNTQSECFSNRGGSNNIYEELKIHHGMGIGWYLVKGGNNLVLNCDAWCNYDEKNGGGNVDGFGCHPSKGDTGNVLRGCRAWWNSDDGFDLIHSAEAVWIDNCWAFYNGYKPNTFKSAADGNGIKAGGYGMSENSKIAEVIPMHKITNCLTYRNKSGGFYSNHHLGGIIWINNTGVYNRWNYNMVNRKSVEEAVDVAGYNHFLANNISFNPREDGVINLDKTSSTIINNSFDSQNFTISDLDFKSSDPDEMMSERQENGSLPSINFMQPTDDSVISQLRMGYTFQAPEIEDITEEKWLIAPTIVTDGNEAWIEGPGAEALDAFLANDIKLKITDGKVNLTGINNKEITLKARLTTGVIIIQTINRE